MISNPACHSLNDTWFVIRYVGYDLEMYCFQLLTHSDNTYKALI